MNKFLKWTLIVIIGLVVLGFAGLNILKWQTKKHSPEATASYSKGDVEMAVVYCRPYKKEREIFGGLVPFGEVWRTGANEATTFSTNADIVVGNVPLKAGEYTLWTIPNANTWEVIINDHEYWWGVDFNQVAQRDPQYDVVNVMTPAMAMEQPVEQFTIEFSDDMHMHLKWDQTHVEVPISKQ